MVRDVRESMLSDMMRHAAEQIASDWMSQIDLSPGVEAMTRAAVEVATHRDERSVSALVEVMQRIAAELPDVIAWRATHAEVLGQRIAEGLARIMVEHSSLPSLVATVEAQAEIITHHENRTIAELEARLADAMARERSYFRQLIGAWTDVEHAVSGARETLDRFEAELDPAVKRTLERMRKTPER